MPIDRVSIDCQNATAHDAAIQNIRDEVNAARVARRRAREGSRLVAPRL
jgi:hypothetical protein